MGTDRTATREAGLYGITARSLEGKAVRLGRYRGLVLLIVNVASACGFTPQYAGLERLYRRHRDRGFAVLGFPCDQFGHQEPGSAEEIRRFCSTRYAVSFPMFEKVEVNGPGAHPLFVLLRHARPGLLGSDAIKWNFTKFLVDRDGEVRRRYAPATTPERIEPELEAVLAEA